LASDPQIVELLLARKPKLNYRDAANGQTPLEHAAVHWAHAHYDKKRTEKWRLITDKLRAAGAEYTLETAILLNDIEHLRAEVKKDDRWVGDPRATRSLLLIAASEGRDEICKLMLDHKAIRRLLQKAEDEETRRHLEFLTRHSPEAAERYSSCGGE
jgi:ankyrin repeat protein